MASRSIEKWRPSLEPMEGRRLCSGGVSVAAVGHPTPSSHPATSTAESTVSVKATAELTVSAKATTKKPTTGFLVYRITNPNRYNNHLTPPFGHVRVQTKRPVAGQIYNVLYVAVRNGTAQTFDANSNFFVRLPNDRHTYPILTGDEQWKPGQDYIFYILSKEYYPLPSQVHSGYVFSLAGARSVAIPGPSGIFLRIKYNPATIDRTLDHIVQFGPGAQGGKGIKFGLPDTAIYEFVSAKTNRNDFGGYF
ncbi:hypothetical protein P12x_006100 (plasmid) [Tundrisphaera lichenicola]|uniref:hypothetical protein n=1 Tax=Tundrisphaera lichenicola TaxID=2029860 RepID=UPI003EB9FF8C